MKNRVKSKLTIDELERLFLLRQVVENLILDTEKEIQKEENTEKIREMQFDLDHYGQQLETINNRIEELNGDSFSFSIQELYAMFGKFDKFIGVEFRPKSESAKNFGNFIMGTLLFNRRERQDLNKDLESHPIPRTNGYVKIDPSELSNLSGNQVNQLRLTGFLSGDISEINHTAIDYNDKYKENGRKSIPGTITVEMDTEILNHEILSLVYYENLIRENKKPMIEAEWDHYYAYRILHNNSSIPADEMKEKVLKPNSHVIKDRIRHMIYMIKIGRGEELTPAEHQDFSSMRQKRILERNSLLEKEIQRSSEKKVIEIMNENIDAVTELKKIAYFYEEENLSSYGAKYPVYLTINRYLHIFIRHFEEFQVGNWKGGKSTFQYNFKDTKRLIENVIQELQSQIDEAIENNRDFNIFDMKAHYYNGNYYAVHVSKSGQLLSFYPHRNE